MDHPQYSPHLISLYFFLSLNFKKKFWGQIFKVENEIMEFLNGLKKKDFNMLKQTMKKSIDNDIKYFEN